MLRAEIGLVACPHWSMLQACQNMVTIRLTNGFWVKKNPRQRCCRGCSPRLRP